MIEIYFKRLEASEILGDFVPDGRLGSGLGCMGLGGTPKGKGMYGGCGILLGPGIACCCCTSCLTRLLVCRAVISCPLSRRITLNLICSHY